MLEERLGRAAHLAAGSGKGLGGDTQIAVMLGIVVEQQRTHEIGRAGVEPVAAGSGAEGVEAQGSPAHDAALNVSGAQGGHGLAQGQIALAEAHLLADAAHEGAGRGDALRQVGVGNGDGLQRRALKGDKAQDHGAVAAHERALHIAPAIPVGSEHPFHHLLQGPQRGIVLGDRLDGQALNSGPRHPGDGEEGRAHGLLVGRSQHEVDEVVALPLGRIVVKGIHEVGDDALHVAALVEEHGHAARGGGGDHLLGESLQRHGLHGDGGHIALDERQQRLLGQIGMHGGETERGEDELAALEKVVAARERLVVQGAHAHHLAGCGPLAGRRKPNAIEGPHIHDVADGNHGRTPLSLLSGAS